jgi:hypothetical protein
MTGGNKSLDQLTITLRDEQDNFLSVYVDVFDNSLSRKWLTALNHLLEQQYHLEKNYCWLGWIDSARSAQFLCDQINTAIAVINQANLGYIIQDHFTPDNTITAGPIGDGCPGGLAVHEKFNALHRYFEDLQGTSTRISSYYQRADDHVRWHIRQLNLLCHEYESLILSLRKRTIPEWQRPSQLMCWLHAPRFALEDQDLELFGIETINRPLGGVYVGVNKAVGKHHWEVFNDEGDNSRIDELTTTVLNNQTEAAGDFDIEWGNNPGQYYWQQRHLDKFRQWLIRNGFDPADPSLTIGHPQIGQVDLVRSFGHSSYDKIWPQIVAHMDVYQVSTSQARCVYDYRWQDADYVDQQLAVLRGEKYVVS